MMYLKCAGDVVLYFEDYFKYSNFVECYFYITLFTHTNDFFNTN